MHSIITSFREHWMNVKVKSDQLFISQQKQVKNLMLILSLATNVITIWHNE